MAIKHFRYLEGHTDKWAWNNSSSYALDTTADA